MKPLLGIISILIGISASLPYIWAIHKGQVKPQRMAWLISLLAKLLSFAAQAAKGAQWSLSVSAAGIISGLVIFGFSLSRGIGGFERKDKLALTLSVISLLIWITSGEALYGLFFAIAADAIGVLLTIDKTYKFPGTESTLTWAMATTASMFGLLAVESYTLGQALFPAYAVLGGAALTIISLKKPIKTAS